MCSLTKTCLYQTKNQLFEMQTLGYLSVTGIQ